METIEQAYQELKEEKPKRKRGRPRKTEIPQFEKEPEIQETKIINEQEALAISNQIITMLNTAFVENGLKPINPMQNMLLNVGLTGFILKYQISLYDYPEILLGAGVVWVAWDKYNEISVKRVENDHNDTGKEGNRENNTRKADHQEANETESDNY